MLAPLVPYLFPPLSIVRKTGIQAPFWFCEHELTLLVDADIVCARAKNHVRFLRLDSILILMLTYSLRSSCWTCHW